MRRVLRALLVLLVAGAGLVLTGPPAAYAHGPVEIPANAPGGVSATFTFGGAVVPHPYTPDPTAYFGANKCQLTYHDYNPTPGCGGFTFRTELHHVREQPGFAEGLGGGSFAAHADTERTFGCLDGAGAFRWDTAFVVRTADTPLAPVYYLTDMSYLLSEFRATPSGDLGPPYFLNFEAVPFTCPAGTTPAQYGLKVTDLRLSVTGSPVFGTQSWTAPGPFYG